MALNFKHLHYFWALVKEGGVMRAGERLHVTPQTVSGQVALLEEALGKPLLRKSGRSLTMTETGKMAFAYADEIFSLGEELEGLLRGAGQRRAEFRVGVADAVPKTVAYNLLEPATRLADPVRLVCREWKLENLLSELALHRLDAVIADVALPAHSSFRAYSHKLGSSGLTFFAAPAVRRRLKGKFPACLASAPILLPGGDTSIRTHLDAWFRQLAIAPTVIGEFDDGALMKAFGSHGQGVFAGPTFLEQEIRSQYGVEVVGRAPELVEHFFVISPERRIRHPCVAAITDTARARLPGA
ncbi:MAG: transcriptional activator NhaR [Burkholderiales bacterium]|nr:transcriptional activator NhaR [Burkholderiales bacterium]